MLKTLNVTGHSIHRFQFSPTGGYPRIEPCRNTWTRAEPVEGLLANGAMGTTRGLKNVEVVKWTTVEKVLEVRQRK